MGKKVSEIGGGVERIYFHIAENKKFRLYQEFFNPDIKIVLANKLGVPICANLRANCNSKTKI